MFAEYLSVNFLAIYDLPMQYLVLVTTLIFVGFCWFGCIFLRPFLRLFVRSRDGSNDIVGYILSCFCVFAMVWHTGWSHILCWSACVCILLLWLCFLMRDTLNVLEVGDDSGFRRRALELIVRDWPQTLFLMLGLAIMLWLNYFGYWTELDAVGEVVQKTLSWPWYTPLGSTVAFVWGYLLARRTPEAQ